MRATYRSIPVMKININRVQVGFPFLWRYLRSPGSAWEGHANWIGSETVQK
jgi:hypothetical protein